jgi:hypothetical protein
MSSSKSGALPATRFTADALAAVLAAATLIAESGAFVTTLLTIGASAATPVAVPQPAQNFAPSFTSLPQFLQKAIIPSKSLMFYRYFSCKIININTKSPKTTAQRAARPFVLAIII